MENEQYVSIVRDKESIVVRGIEKRLTEEGYFIYMSGSSKSEIDGNVPRVSLFITYLPADIIDNVKEYNNFTYICSAVHDGGKRMIVIGEKKIHDDLLSGIPALKYHTWVDRPVDMDDLIQVMKKVIKEPLKTDTDFAEAAPFEESPVAASSKAEKNILIVDDDPSYAKMVREWLKDTYRVDIVTAGVQAITFLAKKKVDLILLDYEMPVVDGPQVLEMFRSEPNLKDIPVVFLTGVGDAERVKRVMSLKPQGYILKSATREDLLASMKKYLP